MNKTVLLYFLLLLWFTLKLDAQETGSRIYKIGFSQCTNLDLWRKTMFLEMQNELISYPTLELNIKDAQNSSEKQINDIRELVSSGIDLLIVSPNESSPLTPIIEETFKKGIPVIVVDRRIDSENYTAFIGANNYSIGKEAGKYAAKTLDFKGKILEIWGLKGSSPAKDRHRGFMEEISKYPQLEIIDAGSGEWEKPGGEKLMTASLNTGNQFDMVFAHNDVMALGAINAYQEHAGRKKCLFIGIDGLPGKEGGIEAVLNKKLFATVLYPTGGGQTIRLVWDILNNKPFSKENELKSLVIDSTNVEAIKTQADEILTLHRKIEFSKKNLDNQVKRFNNQQLWLMVSLVFLLVVILLVLTILRSLRKQRMAYMRLDIQKQEINKQNQELKRISQELNDATQAKLNFFTNISHEFRTPLTLIIGPLENILQSNQLSVASKLSLQMMYRNVNRLLRLINQLMDMRKIENEKMKLKAVKTDIVQFVKEIKMAFDEEAEKRQIDYCLISDVSSQNLFIDKDKTDKIFFNLLSNAFKFISDYGKIEIRITNKKELFEGKENNSTVIEVADNGRGIPEKEIPFLFQPFYQAQQAESTSTKGTGLGLSLSKSFIDLHKGKISVTSILHEGTTFKVYFQHGSKHLEQAEIVESDLEYERTEKNIPALNANETEQIVLKPTKGNKQSDQRKQTLLIVEDNADVRIFITTCLSDQYQIMEASNGKEAFDRIDEQEPDLIICDVMMPVMNGLEFTKKLKSDLRICHIPIILLTARTSHDQKIEGLETGADSYIPKPFNSNHLRVRVAKLIENRQKIRKHYQENLQIPSTNVDVSQLDTNFLKKCNLLVEQNITNSEYGVEELSAEIGLTRVHVYRKIKHLTNLTVSEFIRNIKLKKAAVLLTTSGKSISEIAYETGFSSPSYFSKCFKDFYQVSPSEFTMNKS